MSGHSKWSTIKRKKGAVDAKRGKIFTKLIRELSTASRLGGGEPDANPRLRLAMDRARSANMPKDNIERAIKKGTGGGETDVYEQVVYEGYGPGGTAILLETLTDNRNRTVGEVRHVLTRYNGNLGASGCVAYLFEKRGQLLFEVDAQDGDRLLEAALEAGADDVVEGAGAFEVITGPGDFEAVRASLMEAGFTTSHAEVTLHPSTLVRLAGKEAETMLHLSDALEDLDDVQEVYANYDISDDEMAKLA